MSVELELILFMCGAYAGMLAAIYFLVQGNGPIDSDDVATTETPKTEVNRLLKTAFGGRESRELEMHDDQE